MRVHVRSVTASEKIVPQGSFGLESRLGKLHYFPDAISTTSSFDWFFANSVCAS